MAVVRFDDFELDLDRLQLRRGGITVPTERQVFDLLAYLVSAAGRVVSKEELLDNVWTTRFVTESALTTQIKFARRALGDDGQRQRYIRTVHRRGYEFMLPTAPSVEARPDGAGSTPATGRRRALPDTATADIRGAPSGLTGLVGRDGIAADVEGYLSGRRLVTLVGQGGVGKTSLAMAVLDRLKGLFRDGTVIVDLTPARPGDDIARIFAESGGLGLREGAAVADALAALDAIVVVDNCEHVVGEVAMFIERAVARDDDLSRVLATSREPLGVSNELVVRLPGLSTTAAAGEPSAAARLFLLRAGPGSGALQLDEVESLVALLDGLPLAIELAAAQLGFMTLPELRRRLEVHRYPLTGSGRRPPRVDSLRSSVEWSWNLLDDTERTALTELSIFPRDLGLDGVEGVCSGTDPIGTVRRLYLKSLVTASRTPLDTSRYRLPFGVQDFVRPKQQNLPGGPAQLRRRMWAWAADHLDAWSFEEQWVASEFVDVLLSEHSVIRDAITASTPDGHPLVARLLAASSAGFRYGIGVREGLAGIEGVDTVGLADDIVARVAVAGSEAAYAMGDLAATRRHAVAAESAAVRAGRPDVQAVAAVQQCLGRMLTEPEPCGQLLDAAVTLAVDAGCPRVQAVALGLLGFCQLGAGESPATALRTAEVADALAAPFGWDRFCVATLRGSAAFLMDDWQQANEEFDLLARSSEAAGLGAAAATFRLIATCCVADSVSGDQLTDVIEQFLRQFRRATGRNGYPDAALLLACRAHLVGDVATATRLLDALDGHRLAHQVEVLMLGRLAALLGSEVGLASTSAGGLNAHQLESVIKDELSQLVGAGAVANTARAELP